MRQYIDHQALLPQVLAIARQAGNAIMAVYKRMLAAENAAQTAQLSHKEDGSPLTQADLAAHQVITQALAALQPSLPVVSEEDEDSLKYRLPTGNFWLVDPLDGTKEFLARNGEFTVNIALVQDGQATLGVVVAPALNLAYWGASGLGAYRANARGTERIRTQTAAADKGQPLRVLASKSHMNAETLGFLETLGPYELVQAGSSLKFCRVAEGSADLYPRLGPTCEWDTAAAQAVVEAAGGRVHALDGKALAYGKPALMNPHFVVAAAGAPWLPSTAGAA